MELQFHKGVLPYLKRLKSEMQEQEETQELRLPDDLPDMGRVLNAWGQVILRGKEWHTGSAGISGGVMAWILYAPEDGSPARKVEAWLPFQTRWEIPETPRDGTVIASVGLTGMDARLLSARKLLIRASVCVYGQSWLPDEAELSLMPELPEDVQVLENTYPLCIPKEAGEKTFSPEEELALPGTLPPIAELISYTYTPEIKDRKIMAGRLVFRGTGAVHILYRSEDGTLVPWNTELPFSQFTDLEREYDGDASVQVFPAVTSLEVEKKEDGKLGMTAGISVQYVISEVTPVKLAEDAYSPVRTVKTEMTALPVPALLESSDRSLIANAEETVSGRIEDVSFLPRAPRYRREDDRVEVTVSGQFRLLYIAESGEEQVADPVWEETVCIPADSGCDVKVTVSPVGVPRADGAGGKTAMTAQLSLCVETTARQSLSMIGAMDLGEAQAPDPHRPGLILRRVGEDTLWEIAKSTGSTVEAICAANGITDAPEGDRMLLIPVK